MTQADAMVKNRGLWSSCVLVKKCKNPIFYLLALFAFNVLLVNRFATTGTRLFLMLYARVKQYFAVTR